MRWHDRSGRTAPFALRRAAARWWRRMDLEAYAGPGGARARARITAPHRARRVDPGPVDLRRDVHCWAQWPAAQETAGSVNLVNLVNVLPPPLSRVRASLRAYSNWKEVHNVHRLRVCRCFPREIPGEPR
jgi:hypothetical protein